MNDPNNSMIQKLIDKHNIAMISVDSNDDENIHSKISEENTFTIKMSDANEKEKRLLKKLERIQKENDQLIHLLKSNDQAITKKNA